MSGDFWNQPLAGQPEGYRGHYFNDHDYSEKPRKPRWQPSGKVPGLGPEGVWAAWMRTDVGRNCDPSRASAVSLFFVGVVLFIGGAVLAQEPLSEQERAMLDPLPVMGFLALSVLAGLAHRFVAWERWAGWRRDYVHPDYPGYPRLSKWLGWDERKVRMWTEPFIMLLLGVAACVWNIPLGLFLIAAGLLTHGSERLRWKARRDLIAEQRAGETSMMALQDLVMEEKQPARNETPPVAGIPDDVFDLLDRL